MTFVFSSRFPANLDHDLSRTSIFQCQSLVEALDTAADSTVEQVGSLLAADHLAEEVAGVAAVGRAGAAGSEGSAVNASGVPWATAVPVRARIEMVM